MTQREITFHNSASVRVQAQIFVGRALVTTRMVDPGETRALPVSGLPFDIYLKNGLTGWELAHQLNSEAGKLTLMRQKGRYILT